MYKVSLNTRITKQGLTTTRRYVSTSTPPRQSGMSKYLVGGLAVSAASVAYYQRLQKDHDFYHGDDSDPYARHKPTKSVKKELDYAGDHLKNSAENAAKAARDTFATISKDTEYEANKFKDETESEARKLKQESKHFVEGDRIEEIFARTVDHPEPNRTEPKESIGDRLKNTAESARHKLSNLTKDAEHEASKLKSESENEARKWKSESEQEARKLANESKHFVEGDRMEEIYARTDQHNPMVKEKLNTQPTKTAKETKLENYAENRVHDTTPLVSKDTSKVKPVWDDQHESKTEKEIKTTLEDTKHEVLNTTSKVGHGITTSLFHIFGQPAPTDREPWEQRLAAENVVSSSSQHSGSPNTPERKGTSYDFYGIVESEGNPMVTEKLRKESTKPLWETSLEDHAQEVVKDTSTLVDKDTQKVRQGVWDAKDLANEKTSGALNYKEKPGFWASLFGKSQHVEHDVKQKLDETADDVKNTASKSWQDAKQRVQEESDRVKNNVWSTIDELSNKSKQEASRLESGWNNLKKDAREDANYARGTFRSESDRLASEAKKTAQDVKQEGSWFARRASDEVSQKAEEGANLARRASEDVSSKAREVKDEGINMARRASEDVSSKAKEVKDDSINLARRASNSIYSTAEEVKDKTEDTAKNWYEKGTESVKSGIDSVKSTADEDIHWAEDKLSSGVNGIKETFTDAKEEVGRLFGGRRNSGYEEHVIRGEFIAEDEAGQLRPTRDNVELKSAEVVVEEAHGKDM